MVRLILTFSVLAACSPPLPNNREVDPPTWEYDAVTLAISGWEDILATPLPDYTVPIRWFEGPCLDYDDSRHEHGYECPRGNFMDGWPSGDEIHLVRYSKASETSMAHELLHWSLYLNDTGDPDSDHCLPIWHERYRVINLLKEHGM